MKCKKNVNLLLNLKCTCYTAVKHKFQFEFKFNYKTYNNIITIKCNAVLKTLIVLEMIALPAS